MNYAIISDIHSNIEALDAVLRDIDERGVKEILCLGDVVGYGPDPIPCIDRIQERCFLTLIGNHDDALVNGAKNFNDRAKAAIDWTRDVLEQEPDAEARERRAAFFRGLKLKLERNGLLFVHGSPRDPIQEYLFKDDCQKAQKKIAAAFAAFEKALFVGHTHQPGVITREPRFLTPASLENRFHYTKGEPVIINVGSVGQPRDNDPRACYLEVDKNEMQWRRVEYDVKATAEKIKRIDRLADSLGARLLNGV